MTESYPLNVDESKGPVLSVIVPVHNSADTLGRTLSSLREQQNDAIQTIVVDDGSDDEIEQIVVAARLRDLTLLRQPNMGASAARNAGVKAASGSYVAFLDSDDIVEPEWGQRLIEAAHDRPASIHCGIRIFEGNSAGESAELIPKSLGSAFFDLPGPLLPASYAVQRDIFWNVGGFKEGLQYGEHHELGLRLGRIFDRDRRHSTVVEEILVIKFHDRSPGRVAAYDEARLAGAEYKLRTHRQQLGRDTEYFANLHAVAGVAAARLGRWDTAHQHFLSASVLHPKGGKHFARLVASYTPGIRSRIWDRAPCHHGSAR